MAQEIERKYLVATDAWRRQVVRQARYRQGYLANGDRCSVRVRVDDERGFLNIKTATLDITRTEYDYEIPRCDGEEMLARMCVGDLVEKTRYFVPHGCHTWEVDVFEGANRGLVIAEIELASVEEAFDKPDWLGKEVSDDPRYYNVYLAEHPYKQW